MNERFEIRHTNLLLSAQDPPDIAIIDEVEFNKRVIEHEVNRLKVQHIKEFFDAAEKKMTIKLSLLFIALDLITLLIYPFIYVQGKVNQILKDKDGSFFTN